MRSVTTFAAAALALAVALPAAAQSADSSATDAKAPAEAAASGAEASGASTSSAATGASASSAPAAVGGNVSVGQSVKDNTGATIGQVTALKPDAAGKQVATIKMGADSFAVDTASLAVDNGAAVINASQAEIKGMMGKK
jgi:hypothetical protein